jgi:hypothetical protein
LIREKKINGKKQELRLGTAYQARELELKDHHFASIIIKIGSDSKVKSRGRF